MDVGVGRRIRARSLRPRITDSILCAMRILTALVLGGILISCKASEPVEVNPPSHGFDAAHSDPRAIAIADQVMEAMGGRAAWDATRCVQWKFNGRRKLCWDKFTNDFRLDDGG